MSRSFCPVPRPYSPSPCRWNLSANEQGQARAAQYVEEFIADTGWHPDRIDLFGGALRYSEYGFLQRLMIKQIVKRAMPRVDTANDVKFTNWHELEVFAADVAAFVEDRLGMTPPLTDAQRDAG